MTTTKAVRPRARLYVLTTALASLLAIGLSLNAFQTGSNHWGALCWVGIAVANGIGLTGALKKKED